jgi:hypothetical protein
MGYVKGEGMSNTNTGGPAFPDPQENWRGEKGMTLRDYFAAKAMQGLVAGANPEHPINLHGASEWAYNMANAMLRAREAA